MENKQKFALSLRNQENYVTVLNIENNLSLLSMETLRYEDKMY